MMIKNLSLPHAIVLAALILGISAYASVDTYSVNRALAECAKQGGNIHVGSWSQKHWCDRNP